MCNRFLMPANLSGAAWRAGTGTAGELWQLVVSVAQQYALRPPPTRQSFTHGSHALVSGLLRIALSPMLTSSRGANWLPALCWPHNVRADEAV